MTSSAQHQDLLFTSQTLIEATQRLVEREPAREALVHLDRHGREEPVELQELWTRSRSIHAGLVDRGLVAGQVVVLILPTSPEMISSYFGILLGGGVPALLSTPSHRVADPEIFCGRVDHVVANSSAHSIYCTSEIAATLRGRPALSSTHIVTPEDVGPGSAEPSPAAFDPNAPATMQYSSGTTGTPKGVLLQNLPALNNVRALHGGLSITPEDVSVHWIPLFHDMGLFGAFLLPLLSGCKTVLIKTDDFLRAPELWLHAISRYRGTFSFAPNLAYALCARRLSDAELEGLDLSCWRLALNGSEPVPAATVAEFTERMIPYGFHPEAFSPTWGLAETGAVGTAHAAFEEPRIDVLDRAILAAEDRAVVTEGEGVGVVSVGPALPGVTLEIRDAEGQRLPDRHVGSLWLQSDSLFAEYNRDPDLTARVKVDGWINTGDRGYLDDGHFFFVARTKDVIIVGGEKYMPDDIETAINRVPGIREGCAVAFGILNEERGTEDLAAVVETRLESEEDLAQLQKSIREEVTRATGLGLRYLVLTPPGGTEKTTSGKIARSATRERHLEALLRS